MNLMKTLSKTFVATTSGFWLAASLITPVSAQNAAPTTPTSATPPNSSLAGLQVRAGATGSTNAAPNYAFFHRVLYKGQMLSTGGTEFKTSDSTHQFIDFDAAKINKQSTSGGDTPNVILDFVQGNGAVNDGFFNALGVKEFSVPSLGLKSFRSVVRASSTLDGADKAFAVGLEDRPRHLFGKNFTNWFILGVNGGYESHRNPDNNTGTGKLTYRSFLGYAQWGQTGHPPFSLDDVKNAVPLTDTDTAPFENRLKRFQTEKATTGNNQLDSFINQLASRFSGGSSHVNAPVDRTLSSRADYDKYLEDEYRTSIVSYTYQPRVAYWLESDGWYDFAGDVMGQRARALIAPTFTYYFNLNGNTRSDIQLRYESGFDRGASTTRLNRFLATVGLDF